MGSAGWTVATARELHEQFCAQRFGLFEHPDFRGSGFSVRGKVNEPRFVMRFAASTEHRDEVVRAIPKRFLGIDVVAEFVGVEAAGACMDRLRRATGRRPRQAWPGWPGSALRAVGLRKGGTLGCFVRDASAVYALTCEHVLTNSKERPRVGTKVTSYVVRNKNHEVTLGTVAPTPKGTGPEHDCALVRLGECAPAPINVLPAIGQLSTEVVDLDGMKLGTLVCKYGASSGLTVGTLSGVHNVTQERDGGVVVTLKGVTEVTPEYHGKHRYSSFCSRGDSGSVVAIYTDRSTDVPALGLLVSRETLLERGYIIGLKALIECLNVRMCGAGDTVAGVSGRKRGA